MTDLDAVATRLMKDGVPFVTRSISFYFLIPGTSVVIQVLGEHNYYWTTPFAFCRHTGDDTTRFLPRYHIFEDELVLLLALQGESIWKGGEGEATISGHPQLLKKVLIEKDA